MPGLVHPLGVRPAPAVAIWLAVVGAPAGSLGAGGGLLIVPALPPLAGLAPAAANPASSPHGAPGATPLAQPPGR